MLSPSFVFYYSSELITNHPEPGVLPYPVQPEGLTDHPERMLYHYIRYIVGAIADIRWRGCPLPLLL